MKYPDNYFAYRGQGWLIRHSWYVEDIGPGFKTLEQVHKRGMECTAIKKRAVYSELLMALIK